MRLTEDMQRVVLEQKLGFVATVSADGRPNLSPKGTTTVWDETRLMFADIASPGTIRNLAENPQVEINVVDPIVRKGYRFTGRGRVHTAGDVYERGLQVLEERGYAASPGRIRSIVVIEVSEASELVSPVYADGVSERQVAAMWLQRHSGRWR